MSDDRRIETLGPAGETGMMYLSFLYQREYENTN